MFFCNRLRIVVLFLLLQLFAEQFLFLENKCPEVPITDAFCHFLAWGTLSDWDASSAQNLFPDVLSDPEYQKYIEQFKFFPSPDLGFVTDIGEQVPALSA